MVRNEIHIDFVMFCYLFPEVLFALQTSRDKIFVISKMLSVRK